MVSLYNKNTFKGPAQLSLKESGDTKETPLSLASI